MYDFNAFKKTAGEKVEWLGLELQGLRTGRATPALLDAISVEVYGSRMKLNQVANVAVEDARTLYVNPWDKSQLKMIEKAITLADLGISVGSDEKGIRVSFPELTHERRQQLVKLVHAKLEEARIAVRSSRTKIMNEIDTMKKAGSMGEDDAKRHQHEVQKVVDDINKKLEEVTKKKEVELSS